MKVYEVPYGKGSQQVLLPEEKVSQVLLPPVTEHPRTVEDLMRDALDHPIGSPKLDEIVRAGDKVELAVRPADDYDSFELTSVKAQFIYFGVAE